MQCAVLSSCKKPQKFTDYSFDYFDTVTTIVGFEKSEEEFNKRCESIKQRLEKYHKLYTIYTRYENLNNLCVVNGTTNAAHQEVKVDKEIIELLEFSKQMYEKTNGKVNVAMGSVLSIWHKYREEGMNDPANASLPEMQDLISAAAHTDIEKLIINREKSTVFLADGEMKLDVGAIAKGYAAEQVADWLEEKGVTGYLLNIGGNVKIVGKRPDGEKWTVGIENPDTENSQEPYIELLSLDSKALVTSGSYQRFYTVNGKNYHHIIDPATLQPSEYLLSVSVLCEDSGMADAFSTALFCMNYEDGKRLISESDGIEAMWILKDGTKLYSENFKKYCK